MVRSAATGSPRSTMRSAGRPWSRRMSRSPSACARLRVSKVATVPPGMATSSSASCEQLQEAALRRAALVQLAGGVQVARAVAEGGGHARAVADQRAQLGDLAVELGRGGEVALDRQVGRGAGIEQRRERIGASLLDRRRRVHGQHVVGLVLGGLHVGLVERVDLQHPADDRGGELEEHHDAPEVGGAVGADRDDGLLGGDEAARDVVVVGRARCCAAASCRCRKTRSPP